MTGNEVLAVMASGVSFVCAHCDHFWWSKERGLSSCRAGVDGKVCAGPLMDQAFPEYKGPLGGNMGAYCFVCGEKSKFAAIARKGKSAGKSVGVCALHVSMLGDTGPKGKKPRFLTGDLIDVRS